MSSSLIDDTTSTMTIVRKKGTQHGQNDKVRVEEPQFECLTCSCKGDIKNFACSLHKDTHGSIGTTKALIECTLPSRTYWISNYVNQTTNRLDQSISNLTINFRCNQLLWASIARKFDFGHIQLNPTSRLRSNDIAESDFLPFLGIEGRSDQTNKTNVTNVMIRYF